MLLQCVAIHFAHVPSCWMFNKYVSMFSLQRHVKHIPNSMISLMPFSARELISIAQARDCFAHLCSGTIVLIEFTFFDEKAIVSP